MSKDSILLSPKYGVNPTVTRCICCGDDYGAALLGKLKGDNEAPREIYKGLCDKCQSVVDKGGALIIEVKDGESGPNPCRTGRIIGVGKLFKDSNHIEHPISYMEQKLFSQLFNDHFQQTAK